MAYLNFASIIQKVGKDKKLIPDLMKSENGNNFRAISESAILEAISPVLEENNIYYEVEVKESHLDIKEAYGSKGKKLQFIATITIKLKFYNHWEDDGYKEVLASTEAVGMGIDDNDKAMGKAYTYAIKYALLKLFRLRYGDDPDFETSKPLYMQAPTKEDLEKVVEIKMQPEGTGKKVAREKKSHKEVNKKASGMDKAMTEAQRDYILGMMKQKKVEERQVLETFKVEPSRDEFIPMPTARAIIKWLENDEYLPF